MRFSVICFARKIAPLTIKHSSLPESYIKECTELVEYEAPKLQSHRQITLKRIKNYYDLYRPWSKEFQSMNYPMSKNLKVWVEPIKEWSYFRGDRVEVLFGKDKGKQGIISYVVQERNWVLVKGLNMVLNQTEMKKKIYSLKEAPLLINRQVALVDPVDLKPTQVEWRYDAEGKRVRVSLRSGKILPIPVEEEETLYYKTLNSYVEKGKDTIEEDLSEVTFVPKLKTFEMDIMDEYGIKEDRVPAKTYWY